MITIVNSTSPTVLAYRVPSKSNLESIHHLVVQPKDEYSSEILSDIKVQPRSSHSDLEQCNKGQLLTQKILLIPESVNIDIKFTNGNVTQNSSNESSNTATPEECNTKEITMATPKLVSAVNLPTLSQMNCTVKEMNNHDTPQENCNPGISITKKKKLKVSQQDIAPRPVYRCPLCPYTGKYQVRLDNHMVVHSGERKYTCRHCGKKFGWSSHLTHHERTHSPYPPFQCKVCKKVLLSKSGLDTHMLAQHNPDGPAFQCEQCFKKFKFKVSLDRHAVTHLAERNQLTFLCEYCGTTVESKSNFTKHLNKHTRKQSYDCQQCEMKFNWYDSLRQHVKLIHEGHVKEKRFQCTVCGKLYFKNAQLEIHFIKHTDDRPYVCDLCGKSYRSLPSLKSHKNMHLGVEPFSCDVCGRTFLNYCNKIKHQRRHSEVRPHKCVACDKAFYEKQELSRHIKKNHS